MTGLAPMDLTREIVQTATTPCRPLNRLERAGWAVIAADALALRSGEANVLRDLVFAGGRIVSNAALSGCFTRHETRQPERPLPFRIAVSVARIRNALEDLGLPRSAIRNEREIGYSLVPAYARRVRQIVEGE